MLTIRTILVATDLSQVSLSAIDYAVTLRLAFGAQLHLLYVLENSGVSPLTVPGSKEEAEAQLRAIAGRIAGPEAESFCAVRTGVPADEICRYAREVPVDMIVMATHGRTGLRHMLLGSVAERVVRRSCVPVLTVKPRGIAEDMLREEDVEQDLHLC